MADAVLTGAFDLVTPVQGVAVFGPDNPFYEPSSLPFGVPPFDRIRNEDYEPAIVAGMAVHVAEIDLIARNEAAPTFENTIAAMEKTGLLLDRVLSAMGTLAGAFTNPIIEAVQQSMAPRFAAHSDAIYHSSQLFNRIEAIWQQRDRLDLDGESKRLLEIEHQRFVHAGAKLNDAEKARLKELNAEESTLTNEFGRKLLAANKAGGLVTTDVSMLAGLSAAQLAYAADADDGAEAARIGGVEGYTLPLQNTTQQPLLEQLSVRETRKALFEQSWTRAEKNDDNDTRATIARLAQVRAAKAKLLGFSTYAAWKLENQMAKTPQAVVDFLDAMVPAAKTQVSAEQKEIEAVIANQGGHFDVAPWDWDFYSEQVRKAKYDLDEQQVRPYFEVNRVLEDGVFYAATRLYGITFVERHDLPVWAPDVRVFEISNADQSHLAIFYIDLWKRDNKRGGAWMSSLVGQSKLLKTEPVIYNVANFAKPMDGQPGLISFSDVITLFHEFGHTLHGMFSEARYPSLAGTSVPRDFVEFPSQFNELWALDPEVFLHYAKHYETGEPMPGELFARITQSISFNEGYKRTELLAAAALDMEWHMLSPDASAVDPGAFEEAALKKKGLLLAAVPPRYRSTFFAHIWGTGYAAGYYAYMWAEMLENTAIDWFRENGGLQRVNGNRLRSMILSRGNTEELGPMFERWLGDKVKKQPANE